MSNPTGRVLSLVDSPDGARAIVAMDDLPACPRCAAGKGCGAGVLAMRKGQRNVEARLPSGLVVTVADVVELSLAPDNVLRAAAIVYGIPMLGALAGAAIAYAARAGDAGAASAVLLGLAVGLFVSRQRLRRTDCLQRFTPTVEKLC